MFTDNEAVLGIVRSGFEAKHVLVVGDVMLDRYVWGDVTRVSPEAPVPVVRVARRTEAAGGAANVAANLAGLGIRASLVTVFGADADGARLSALLTSLGVEIAGSLVLDSRPTITKTRVIGGHQQMMRLDEEETSPLETCEEASLVDAVSERLDGAAVVILSDYAKGVLSASCCREIIARAEGRGTPVLVDPKGLDYTKYAGATVVTPNVKELAAAAGRADGDRDGLRLSAMHLRAQCRIGMWIITQGERGILLMDSSSVRHFPAMARDVFDVSGAGDTVIATLAASMAAGLQIDDAVRLANIAAGVVVGKVGTVPIERSELLAALELRRFSELAGKIVERAPLLKRVSEWRSRGDRIVFTNGCFDIVHVGHVTYLEKARDEGHRLVVGLNTDRSVRVLKGKDRPIVPEMDRARVLASLASVDAVVLFDSETPIDLINSIRPDVIVKGDDYSVDDVVGAKEVREWRGDVVLIPMVEGRSTTQIMGRILEQV